MEVVVDLAETNISTSDLIGLRVGDIIATEKDVAPAAGGFDRRPAQISRPSRARSKAARRFKSIGPIDVEPSVDAVQRRLRCSVTPARLHAAGGDGEPAIARTASTSISAASAISTTPAHGTGSVGARKLPVAASKNFGSVIFTSAQVLIVYINTVGSPVTNHTSGLRRVRHSQTVTPSSVSAASN